MDVTVGPSPAWLVERLTLQRRPPINNIVDVTNYVLLERTSRCTPSTSTPRAVSEHLIVRTARPARR